MSYKVQRPCRVCGKMYTPCSDCEKDKSAFHWRTVACSIECGREYFKRIEESRKILKTEVIPDTLQKAIKGNNMGQNNDGIRPKRYTRKKNEESEQIE